MANTSETDTLPRYTLTTPVGGMGFTTPAEAALAEGGWGSVQATLAGACTLLDGANGGDAVAWCGLLDGQDPEGEPARLLGIVLTWSTDAVGEDALRAVSKALAAGLGSAVRVEGPQAPPEGFFPSVAVLSGQVHRVWLPQAPRPVVVWAGAGPEGGVALFGSEALEEAPALLDAPDVVLAMNRAAGPEALDRDEALFLVHAAGRLAQVVDTDTVVRWMQRRLGPVLSDEGFLHDDGRLDSEAVREAVEDAVAVLRKRDEPSRRRLVQVLGEPLAATGGMDERVARELALAMSALDLVVAEG